MQLMKDQNVSTLKGIEELPVDAHSVYCFLPGSHPRPSLATKLLPVKSLKKKKDDSIPPVSCQKRLGIAMGKKVSIKNSGAGN